MNRARTYCVIAITLGGSAAGAGAARSSQEGPVQPPAAEPAVSAPPALTAPSRPWLNKALSPSRRTELLLTAMTLDERIRMVHAPFAWPHNNAPIPEGAIGSAGYLPANPRLGIPALQETDASLGITNPFGFRMNQRVELGATALPSGLALAATFDPDLAYAGGRMIAGEARDKGFNILLAGGVNLARDPRNGRNFEYLGEDPLLAGMMGGAQIRGVQSRNIIATVKHFSLNGQETNRFWANSVIDEAPHRESDLLAFEIAIEQGQPAAVMCGYNLVNGSPACSNRHLLIDVLKRDWQYPGWVMSDWATTHGVADAANGLDQQQGEQADKAVYFGEPLKKAVLSGEILQARLDDMVRRILTGMFRNGLFDDPSRIQPTDYAANARVARAVAENGIVLLKNERGMLPLAAKAQSILVVGGHAEAGVLSGGGSSQVIAPGGKRAYVHLGGEGQNAAWRGMLFHQSSPLVAIRARNPSATVTFNDGRYPAEAARLAAKADIVVVFANQWMTEGEDVPDLDLPSGQDALIAAVAAANANTAVVLETGGPVAMPWIDGVRAILSAWYAGASGGDAIADILFGITNPSGRLPVTFPKSIDQYPRRDIPGRDLPKETVFDVPYVEGAAVGYRRFARDDLKTLFPFGHGLSYTRFAYSNLRLNGGKDLTVSFDVTNAGGRIGKDVPQVYLVARNGTPSMRLIGFEKLELSPAGQQRVTLKIDSRLLSDFDVAHHRWRQSAGSYEIAIGSSAETPALRATVQMQESTRMP